MKIATNKNSYKYYKKKSKSPVSREVYSNIQDMYHAYLVAKLFKGEIVSLPRRFGTIQITGKKHTPHFNEEGKIDNLAIDWGATNKLWAEKPELRKKKFIYCDNAHSDGIRYSFVWHKKEATMPLKSVYRLTFCKDCKRALAKLVKGGASYPNIGMLNIRYQKEK